MTIVLMILIIIFYGIPAVFSFLASVIGVFSTWKESTKKENQSGLFVIVCSIIPIINIVFTFIIINEAHKAINKKI